MAAARPALVRGRAKPLVDREPLWTDRFVTLMVAGFANFFALGTIAPLLPRFVKDDLGGSNFVIGVMVALYACSAVLVRPSAARWADAHGRRRLILVGAALTAVSLALYGVGSTYLMLVPARLLTGIGQALYFTGAAIMVVELAPASRRGEALSFYSVSVYLGNGLGPALGEALHEHASMEWGFACAAIVALAGTLIALRLRETVESEAVMVDAPPSPDVRPARINRVALAPGAVLALGMIGSTAFSAYVPLYSDELGMNGSQWVFLSYSVTVIAVRVFGSRLPDILGEARSGTIATIVIASGMALMTCVPTPMGLYTGSIVLAIGTAFLYPALMSLVVARASAAERSAAVATFTSFFDIAIGFGGLSIGAVAEAGGYRSAFATAATSATIALAMLRLIVLRRGSPNATTHRAPSPEALHRD